MSIPLFDALFKKPAAEAEPPAPDSGADTGTDANWKHYGFQQSRLHQANPIALEVELHKLLEQYKKSIHTNEEEQEQMKAPLRARIAAASVDEQRLAEFQAVSYDI